MAKEPTQEEVLQAARALGSDDFTREDVAKQLGSEISEMQPAWKAAKEANQLTKVGDRRFKLAEG